MNPFAVSRTITGTPSRAPYVRQTLVAHAPGLADVLAAKRAHQPVAGRDAPGQVPGQNEEDCAQGLIWYCSTQSFTTSQSRLSKNASM